MAGPRRRASERLTTLLAGFCVAEEAVAVHLTPYASVARNAKLASHESLMAWVFFLQRRDDQRHTPLFDRIAEEVLALPGDTPDERRAAAREHAPAAILELFEEQLPAMAAGLADGANGLARRRPLPHAAGGGRLRRRAARAARGPRGRRPARGARGDRARRRDERWHVGFGLRCLIETKPSLELLEDLLERRAGGRGVG